ELTKLPAVGVIVVLTKCDSPNDPNTKKFLEKAKEAFQGCTVLRTRVGQEEHDDDGNLIKTKPDWSIDELIDTSLELVPDSQKQALIAAFNLQHQRALQAKRDAAKKPLTGQRVPQPLQRQYLSPFRLLLPSCLFKRQ
ncbi:MAG: hypothetical protein J6P47_06245, partial [Acetobacter sp.]|nr:hypothetical protein [Acetobacter sp.]